MKGNDYEAYSNLHALTANELHGAHDVLLHLHKLRQLLGKIGTESASGISAERVTFVMLVVKDATVTTRAYQCCSCRRIYQPWWKTTGEEGFGSAMQWVRATGAWSMCGAFWR